MILMDYGDRGTWIAYCEPEGVLLGESDSPSQLVAQMGQQYPNEGISLPDTVKMAILAEKGQPYNQIAVLLCS